MPGGLRVRYYECRFGRRVRRTVYPGVDCRACTACRVEAKMCACLIWCPKNILSFTSTAEFSTWTARFIASTAGSEGSAKTILDIFGRSAVDSDVCTRSESSLSADRLSFSIHDAETTKSHLSGASSRRSNAKSEKGPFSFETERSTRSNASVGAVIAP